MSSNTWIQRAAIRLAALAAFAAAPAFAEPSTGRGYFISIDGLQPELLRSLDRAGKLDKAKGLGALHREALVVDAALPLVTTITAPSHISTATCTPPSRHGIIANSYLKDGKKVSGYSSPFATEPLWRAAMRQGKKVLALAYVGTDGPTPERTTDWSLNYPDDTLIGPHQTLDLDVATLPNATGWTLKPLMTGEGARETTITLKLNPKTNEQASVNVLIVPNRVTGTPDVWLDADKDLTNGVHGTLRSGTVADIADIFVIETHADSTLKGAKRRAFARRLPADAGKLSIYVSKPSYNHAQPASFRQRLDELNLVWPDYGVRSPKITLAEYLETQAMIDRFLTDVGVKMVGELNPDVVLYYNPLIDSVGHKLQSKLPLPFNPNGTDEITKTFVEAFRIVDANVDRLLAASRQRDVVALMGDHGMDAIHKTVNVARLLPADHIGKVEVLTSGSLTLLYPAQNSTDPDRDLTARVIGASLKDALAALTHDGKPVAGAALSRDDFTRTPDPAGDYTKEWAYGEAIWAYTTTSGFWYQYLPLDTNTFLEPAAPGMHGQLTTLPSMATVLMVKGPNVRARHVANGSLGDAAPTFMKLLGLTPPAQCVGKSLL